MSQAIAEPVAPEVREPKAPDDVSERENRSIDLNWVIGSAAFTRFVDEIEARLRIPDAEAYLASLAETLCRDVPLLDAPSEVDGQAESTEATEGDTKPADGRESNTAPAPDGNGATPTAAITTDAPWRKVGEVFRDLLSDTMRLHAAQTLIDSAEPDDHQPLDGSDACAVERIVGQVRERLVSYRATLAEALRDRDVPTPRLVPEPAGADSKGGGVPLDRAGLVNRLIASTQQLSVQCLKDIVERIERSVGPHDDKVEGDTASAPTNDEPEPENSLPNWSQPEWAEFEQAVSVLPGFPKIGAFQIMLDNFVEGVDELVALEGNRKSLMSRCRHVADHCVGKGGAA